MASTTFTELANLLFTNYGSLVAQAFTQFGVQNGLVDPKSFFGLLQRYGCVTVGSGDMSDRYAKEWAAHYAKASAASYGANDAWPAATPNSYNTASLEWKRIAVPMEMDNLPRVASLAARGNIQPLQKEFMDKLNAIIEGVETQILGDGTGNSSKDITGALAFLSTSNTYAGINQSSASYWQARVTNASSATLTKAHLHTIAETLWNNGGIGSKSAILMSSTQWSKFKDLYSASIRTIPGGLGSDAVEPRYVDGIVDLPIHVVPSMSQSGYTDEIWFLNFGDLQLAFLDHTPKDEIPVKGTQTINHAGVPIGIQRIELNKDAEGLVIKAYCQLSCLAPRNQGRIHTLAT